MTGACWTSLFSHKRFLQGNTQKYTSTTETNSTFLNLSHDVENRFSYPRFVTSKFAWLLPGSQDPSVSNTHHTVLAPILSYILPSHQQANASHIHHRISHCFNFLSILQCGYKPKSMNFLKTIQLGEDSLLLHMQMFWLWLAFCLFGSRSH